MPQSILVRMVTDDTIQELRGEERREKKNWKSKKYQWDSMGLGEFTEEVRVRRSAFWGILAHAKLGKGGKASKGCGEGAACEVRGK